MLLSAVIIIMVFSLPVLFDYSALVILAIATFVTVLFIVKKTNTLPSINEYNKRGYGFMYFLKIWPYIFLGTSVVYVALANDFSCIVDQVNRNNKCIGPAHVSSSLEFDALKVLLWLLVISIILATGLTYLVRYSVKRDKKRGLTKKR